jgi:hypothetical protein
MGAYPKRDADHRPGARRGVDFHPMNRTNRMNESRAARAHWMTEARRAADNGATRSRAECVRKARFHHANLMGVKLAEWA